MRRLLAAERRVEKGGVHTRLFQRADLVVHQRDQGADDDGHALLTLVPRDRRDLVAQAFAAAGGHQHQRVAAGGHMVNDLALRAPESRVAEDFLQDARGGW